MTSCVVVTGLGAITSAGPDAEALRDAVASGRSGLTPVHDVRYRPTQRVMAGLVNATPDPIPGLPDGWPKPDRFVDLALVAAGQAMQQAGLDTARLGRRMAAVVGTCSGPTTLLEAHYQAALKGAPDRSPDQLFRLSYGSAVRVLAHVFDIRGFTGTVTTACSAGLTAIGTGLDLIRVGLCDAVLVGGADAFNLSTQIGFDGLKAPSDGPCAPFSKPIGLCLGEGAAFLVLESEEHARARGAAVRARILGFGMSNDAYHSSAPDPSGRGQALAVIRALEDAGVVRDAIAYVNAHGTGTLANDKAETKVIRRVFRAGANTLPVSSQKAVFGHTLGAAGAVELAGAILCCEEGVLPPTAHFNKPREGCDLDYVKETGRAFPRDRLWVKENFAFGGHNAALVVGAAQSFEPLPARPRPAKVCLSAIGLVTSAGAGCAAFRRLMTGSGPDLRECAPAGHVPIQAALAPDKLDPVLERRLGLSRMDKATALGAIAAHQALSGAGLTLRPEVVTDVGLFLGHASGSNAAEAAFLPDLLNHDYVLQRVTDFTYVVPNATAGAMCRALDLRGHHATFCFGEGAGLMTLIAGAIAMINRHAPFLLVGAVDLLTARGWGHALPTDGPPPTEGAAFFLLETEEHVRARGGRALAVIEGMAVVTEAAGGCHARPTQETVHMTECDALEQAGLTPADDGVIFGRTPDAAARIGWAEACGPLFDMVAVLLEGGLQPDLGRPLLQSVSSRQGWCASIVCSPFPDTGVDE